MPTLEGQGNQPSTHRHHHRALHRQQQNNHGSHLHHPNITRQAPFSLLKDLEDTSVWFTGSFEQAALQG